MKHDIFTLPDLNVRCLSLTQIVLACAVSILTGAGLVALLNVWRGDTSILSVLIGMWWGVIAFRRIIWLAILEKHVWGYQ